MYGTQSGRSKQVYKGPSYTEKIIDLLQFLQYWYLAYDGP